MRAVLLGTSNAIYRDGYAEALGAAEVSTSLLNRSIGASPNLLIPYRLHGLDVRDVDVAFLETAVNDAATIRAGTYTLDTMRAVFDDAIPTLQAAGVTPIGLIIPGRTRDAHTSAVVETQRALFASHGVRFFDAMPVFEDLARSHGCSYENLFLDAAHPRNDLFRPHFDEFARTLAPPERRPGRVPRAGRFVYRPFVDCANVCRGDGSACPSPGREFQTSLVTGTLHRVENGDTVRLALGERESLAALVVNTRATAAWAIVEGRGRVVKDMRFDQNPRDVKIQVSPFLHSLQAASGVLELRFVAEPQLRAEPSYLRNPALVATGCAELVGFVVERHPA